MRHGRYRWWAKFGDSNGRCRLEPRDQLRTLPTRRKFRSAPDEKARRFAVEAPEHYRNNPVAKSLPDSSTKNGCLEMDRMKKILAFWLTITEIRQWQGYGNRRRWEKKFAGNSGVHILKNNHRFFFPHFARDISPLNIQTDHLPELLASRYHRACVWDKSRRS